MKRIITLLLATIILMSMNISAYANSTIDQSIKSNGYDYALGYGINEGYTIPTQEQIDAESAKAAEAERYVALKRKELRGSGGSKTNLVGTFKQSDSNTCGPASARNAIIGYLAYNDNNYTAPSEGDLGDSAYLNTNLSGTDFNASRWGYTMSYFCPKYAYLLCWGTNNWNSDLQAKVIYTIDRPYNVNVIANLNHGYTTTPINPAYTNGIAHYVCVYGYNDNAGVKKYNICDSKSSVTTKYTTDYLNLANSTVSRGVIW